MKRFAGGLSGCPDAFYRRGSFNIGVEAAHEIVSSWPNGDWLVYGVDEIEFHGDLSNHGQPFVDFVGSKVA